MSLQVIGAGVGRTGIYSLKLLVARDQVPLCRFLGQPVPDVPFPNTSSAQELWKRLSRAPHAER